jgi:hypothetical protein
LHPPRRLHRPECSLATLSPELKLVLPRGLAPRTSAFARRNAELLHLGSKIVRHVGWWDDRAPPPSRHRHHVFGRDACCCYTNDAIEMVAASGIAPNSPRLQRGANLSQLHSLDGPSARYRAAVFRLSGGCSALELRRNEMVARRGNAPRSAGCKPAALLLSYQAKKWRPHPVMLRGFLVENQACCYCTMRAKILAERQGLPLGRRCEMRSASANIRSRVWRIEPWTPLKVLLFSRQLPRPTGRAPFFWKWLSDVDSHHDEPFNRRPCYFHIIGDFWCSRQGSRLHDPA